MIPKKETREEFYRGELDSFWKYRFFKGILYRDVLSPILSSRERIGKLKRKVLSMGTPPVWRQAIITIRPRRDPPLCSAEVFAPNRSSTRAILSRLRSLAKNCTGRIW